MKRKDIFRAGFVVILWILVVYVVLNKETIVYEHLTSGPPTLLTLQKDTEDLQGQITTLNNTVAQMTQQAQAQSSQAAAAKAQLSAAKYS
jgi:hypothetical protein